MLRVLTNATVAKKVLARSVTLDCLGRLANEERGCHVGVES